MVYDVPGSELRGEHAHLRCHQFLIAAHGSLKVTVDDGSSREIIVLDRPNIGLYLPPMIWGEQHEFGTDSVLLVFASHPYDPADYIRDYSEFQELLRTERW